MNIKTIAITSFITAATCPVFAEEPSSRFALNAGISNITAGVGIGIEAYAMDKLSLGVGVGTLGGPVVHTTYYLNGNDKGLYLGTGYGVVEVQDTYVNGQWKEEKLKGVFALVGYKLELQNENYWRFGAGLVNRLEDSQYESEYFDDETTWLTLDITYGIRF